jgi:hypothetical protein
MQSSGHGGDSDSEIFDAVPDYTHEIRLALRVLQNSDERDHQAVMAQIMRAGVSDPNLALRLYQMIPIAWARFFLLAAGLYLPDEYIVFDRRTGEYIRDRFSECELFGQIQEVLLTEVGQASREQRERVLMRSPEYDAFRQHLAAGAHPSNLMLGPPILT